MNLVKFHVLSVLVVNFYLQKHSNLFDIKSSMSIEIKNLFVTSCLVILMIGCNDNTDKGVFSGTYVTQEVEINDVRLFTSAGEIENTTIINNFIERQDK